MHKFCWEMVCEWSQRRTCEIHLLQSRHHDSKRCTVRTFGERKNISTLHLIGQMIVLSGNFIVVRMLFLSSLFRSIWLFLWFLRTFGLINGTLFIQKSWDLKGELFISLPLLYNEAHPNNIGVFSFLSLLE